MLQEMPRSPVRESAAKAISTTPVHERIKRLETPVSVYAMPPASIIQSKKKG